SPPPDGYAAGRRGDAAKDGRGEIYRCPRAARGGGRSRRRDDQLNAARMTAEQQAGHPFRRADAPSLRIVRVGRSGEPVAVLDGALTDPAAIIESVAHRGEFSA